MKQAPGSPGIPARWTSSEKSGVGTALTPLSRVWFTLSHGILNEIYYPRTDLACTRDFGLLVADGQSYFSEEKRDCKHHVETLEDGVPAFNLTNTCVAGRYVIEKTIIADPRRDALLQRIRFTPLKSARPLRLFALLAPHLVNRGYGNTAWIDDYKGEAMLFARGKGTCLALASSAPWLLRSAGFVGKSDGWQQLSRDFDIRETYERASDGNVALTGEIDLAAAQGGTFRLALGFGHSESEAALHARASLLDDFDESVQRYARTWRDWQRQLRPLDEKHDNVGRNTYRVSAAVLRCHEETAFGGSIIASLAVPWGFARGDDDLGGYHLVWPRDLAETAGALLAAEASDDAVRVLSYLESVQEADGHWPQNMWLDGTSYWTGLQMDETAFPILLTDLCKRCGALTRKQLVRFWPMVRSAVHHIARKGPVTGQDRWEENGGFSVFTLAVEIAALLAAADLADATDEPRIARYLRETADDWNSRIEWLTYCVATELARQCGVRGYYVRISPPDFPVDQRPVDGVLRLKNLPQGQSDYPAWAIVSPDALALVRFGLRAADDPRILDTLKVIDATLKVDLPTGPCWHRYNHDGYGEHEDGSAFDGTGIGRAWPLLTGERAHYEIAAGHLKEAAELLATLESCANRSSLLPEQVWDCADIPERELFFGHPSGSAMPLVWAHAEHIKLRRSIADQAVFDLPPQPVERYQKKKVEPRWFAWHDDQVIENLPEGRILRVQLTEPAVLRWSLDDWKTWHDSETEDCGLNLHYVDLPTTGLPLGHRIQFTPCYTENNRWRGSNVTVTVVRLDPALAGG
jgi:glucoamylase